MADGADKIRFLLDGEVHTADGERPTTTVLEYLRENVDADEIDRTGEGGEFERHAGRRQTAGEIENVCRQAAHAELRLTRLAPP